jgi:alkylation response protein AidB-like acyl-CoA dehydrogenase
MLLLKKLPLLIKETIMLNGTKNWITNGSSASTYIVIAQTDIERA